MLKRSNRFILAVLLIGIAIRFITMVAYSHFWLEAGKRDVIAPDGEWYSQRGWYIARVLAGKPDYTVPSNEFVFKGFERVVDYYGKKLPPFNSRGNGLITYFIGIVYFIFGYSPFLIKSFNIIINVVSSLLVYRLALELSTERAAKISFLIFTFFPSIFVFSITALKDPPIIFCMISILYLLVLLNKRIKFRYFLFLACLLAFILFLREEFFIIMSISITFAILVNRRLKHKALFILVLIVSVLAVNNYAIFRKVQLPIIKMAKNAAAFAFLNHASWSTEDARGRLAYRIFPDRHYSVYEKAGSTEAYLESKEKIKMKEFVKYIPKGLFFYFTRPFPFVRPDIIYLLMSLQMIYWYVTLGLSVFGIFRIRFSSAYPVFIYLFFVLSITSMVEGNEGILFRHRDVIAPFFILFASAEIDKILRLRWLEKETDY